MKSINRYSKLFSLLLALICLGTACSKDDELTDTGFSVANAEQYYLHVKFEDDHGSQHALLDFQPNQTVTLQLVTGSLTDRYEVIENENTMIVGLLTIGVEDGRISTIDTEASTILDYTLIKKSDAKIPVEGLFAGTYFRANGNVLHEKFYYRFIDGNKVQVGFDYQAAPVRIETYRSIGNIGAWIEKVTGTDSDRELLLYVDGKLQVTYSSGNVLRHGSFTQVPQ